MYSSVNNHDKSQSILSLQELIGVIVVFSFVLYLLFPKGNIEDFLENQGSNTNLSINYLQSMILYHPNNIELKMILMEKYTLIGKEDKALEINRKLIKETKEKKLLVELYKVEYLLHKSLYFKKQDPKKLEALKEKLLAYYAYTKAERDYLFFFAESTNIDYSYLKYHSLKHFMKENPDIVDYELEKMAFDLANQLGYKEEAYHYLQALMKYPNIPEDLSEYLIYSLFERGEFTKAKEFSTKLFLKSQNDDELTKYFHLALYAYVQAPNKSQTEVSQLILDYANKKRLYDRDIVIILSTLLELGETKEATNFAINIFYSTPQSFDETGIDLALKSLLYNSELEHARALSFFAQSKFKKQKYLDQTIRISGWLGESEAVAALNREGYFNYNATKYETYFLKRKDFDSDYEILGLIYKKKIENRVYEYIDDLANYYDYTGEINQAEAYFTQLAKEHQNQKILYYAIEFSQKNSHFEKAIHLYKRYQATYPKNKELHEHTIKMLLALKRFDEAYAMSKTSTQKEQQLIQLAWFKRDYEFLYQKLWEKEKKNRLNSYELEQLTLLEKNLNHGLRLSYLYQEAWRRTHKAYYLNTLLYQLLSEKNFKQFKSVLSKLTKKQQKILSQDIEFQTLLANYYAQSNQIDLALKHYDAIFKISPNSITTYQSYLWFLLDNQNQSTQITQRLKKALDYLQKYPPLRRGVADVAIVAAMNQKAYHNADYWLQELRVNNPYSETYQKLTKELKRIQREKLYAQYNKMLNQAYLKSELHLKRKNLGSTLSVDEVNVAHQWEFAQNLKSKFLLQHFEYKQKGIEKKRQRAFDLSIQNSQKKLLWEFHLGGISANKNFISSSLNLSYQQHNIQLNLSGKYQNKTNLTPFLEQNALENAQKLDIQIYLNHQVSLSFLLQESQFKTLDNLDIGEAKNIQLSANYLLRSSYPDIRFNSYLSHNQFSKNIAHDFWEFGIGTSIGRARQHTLNSSWRPFSTISLAINNSQNFGTSLNLGVSKTVKGDDTLELFFDYYNGIGLISEPIYGLNVKYRF